MIRKKHLQNKVSMKTKKLADNHNARVTVQYIQNPQVYQKPANVNNNIQNVASQDLDIENVEYLEDNTNVEEYIDESGGKEEDSFYPNAIHCLLDLYKNRYESFGADKSTANEAQLWRDIAKDMQESFFVFNEHQIQLKYASLRDQYFSIQTKDEIENFDYFEQLHEIYKDQCKESIIRGYNATKMSSLYYKDEIVLQPEHLEINETQTHDFKSEEIAHKEHEFIDMVEKELQAMEGVPQADNIKDTTKTEIKENIERISSKKLKSILSSIEQPQNKRPCFDTELCNEREESKKSNEHFKRNETQENVWSGNKNNDFSLYLYNQEQERRHREKMSLFEKSLKLQEQALEQQHELLRELIKRLPS